VWGWILAHFLFSLRAAAGSLASPLGDDAPYNVVSDGDNTWEHEPLPSSHETTASLSPVSARGVFAKIMA